MRITFEISSTTIQLYDVIDLYINILKYLKQKLIKMQLNKPKNNSFASNRFNQIEKFYLNKIWTPKL